MRDPYLIHGLLRCAFHKGPSQNFDNDDEQMAQVGNDAQAVSLWEAKIPKVQLDKIYSVLEMEKYQDWLNLPSSGNLLVHWTYEKESAAESEPGPKGPKLPFQYTPLCALCDKTVQKLRFREDHLVVQWNCEQIYSTDAGSPHAMLVSIIGQLFRQYDFDTWPMTELLADAKRERHCSIKTLTRLLHALIDELPISKTVVVIIEGVALLDTKEFEKFKGATLQTMRYLLEEVHNATTTNAKTSTILNTPRAKFKVLVASAPAPSWHAMFKPEEVVQLEAPAPSPPSGLGELDISEAIEDDYEKLDIWNPRAYLDSSNRESRWFPKDAIDTFEDQYRVFPYPWSRVFSS